MRRVAAPLPGTGVPPSGIPPSRRVFSRLLILPLLLCTFLAPVHRADAMPRMTTLTPLQEGERLLDEGKLPEAKEAFGRALAADPSNLSAHKALAVVLDRQGDADAAILHYEKSLLGEPADSPGIRTNLASLYNLQGHPAKAVRLLEPVLPIGGKDATAHLVLGMAYLGTGEREKALARFREVERLEPSSERGALGAVVALRVSGRLKEAKAELVKASKAFPSSSAVPYQLGEVLASLGDLPGAMARFRESEKKGGDAVLLKKRIADLHMEAKRYKEAVPLYRELLGSKVAEEVYGNLAAAQRLSADEKGALSTLAEMEKRFPGSAAAPHRIGLLHGIAGRTDEAVAAFRRALAKAPTDPVVKRDLAVALCRKGIVLADGKKFREAVKVVKEALAVSTDFPGRHEAAKFVKDTEADAVSPKERK